jgi:hypothetical protein
MPPKVYLLAQTHIDPVWLWDWTEGVAVTLATFRSVAALCERYPELRFNQNEALLYEWTEEYAPELFERIRQLVERGQWHVAGGWYLQPDCNLPCGEAMVRQILVGRRYFRERFGVEPVVALNVDLPAAATGDTSSAVLRSSGCRCPPACSCGRVWMARVCLPFARIHTTTRLPAKPHRSCSSGWHPLQQSCLCSSRGGWAITGVDPRRRIWRSSVGLNAKDCNCSMQRRRCTCRRCRGESCRSSNVACARGRWEPIPRRFGSSACTAAWRMSTS